VRRVGVGVLCLALALSTAGCGDDSEPSDGTAGGTAGPATTTGSTGSDRATTTAEPDATGNVDDTAGDGASDGEASDGATSTETGDAQCACLVDEGPADCSFDELHALAECTPEVPCGVATVTCPGGNPDLDACAFEEREYDEAALQCVLEALRDDVPGRYDIVRHDTGVPTTGWLNGDGWFLGVACLAEQPIDIITSRSQLAEPAFFEACLDNDDPAFRQDCLWAGFGDSEPATCDG